MIKYIFLQGKASLNSQESEDKLFCFVVFFFYLILG